MSVYKFPENFKWGSATSSHQIEGGNNNDWSEWEKSATRIGQLKKEGKDPANFISGKACDSYNRYSEDFDIAKQLNQNIHRFSIEWSRIEPEEGRFDEKEMQHYIDLVKSLRDRGIEPMITLWHFTNPVWFSKKSGFLNKKSPEYFTRYATYVATKLKDKVGLWITFNEAATVYSGFAYLKGLWPPHHRSFLEWRMVNRNILRSHVSAYKEIKKLYSNPANLRAEQQPANAESGAVVVWPSSYDGHSPVNLNNQNSQNTAQPASAPPLSSMSHNVMIGLTENNAYVVVGNNLVKRIIGKLYNYYRNLDLFYRAFPHYDFIGLNYYNVDRKVFKNYDILPKQEISEEMGWELYPEGLHSLLKQFKKFKKPIFITENGIADASDQKREKFIKEHLFWIHEAIKGGVDVRGYLYWSLLDNFEWHHGFTPRFGLVEVDYKTFERHIRPSALEYAKICKGNQLEIDS